DRAPESGDREDHDRRAAIGAALRHRGCGRLDGRAHPQGARARARGRDGWPRRARLERDHRDRARRAVPHARGAADHLRAEPARQGSQGGLAASARSARPRSGHAAQVSRSEPGERRPSGERSRAKREPPRNRGERRSNRWRGGDMKDIKVSDTHNYAIVGHAHDGKTSLGEAILHSSGATHALGSVAAGTSVLNILPEEKERKTTMTSCAFSYDAGGKHFTLVDTPGDSNFAADAQIVLQRLDGAVLVVSAVDGARVGTDRMYRYCREHQIPIVAFVNGLDRERASFEAALESLEKIEAKPVPLTLPIGEHEQFSGVVDLWTG